MLLQMCPSGQTAAEAFKQFEFVQAILCEYTAPAGLLPVGMIVFGAVAASIYVRTGSPIIPFGLLLLTGGVVMSTVSGVAVGFATILVLLVGGGVFAYAYAALAR